jgi:hypothetical protein
MAIDFPNSPSTNDIFTSGGRSWTWTGTTWQAYVQALSNSSITNDLIADATITAAKIANATITSTQIANTTITATQIANATITATQIANATVTATQIANATITGAKIADRAIGSNDFDGMTLNAQTGTTYTLVAGDAHKLVTLSNASAIALTVPTNASVAFVIGDQVNIVQLGAGQVTVSGAGVTLRSQGSKLKLNGQYSAATLIKIGTDEWVLVGNTAA